MMTKLLKILILLNMLLHLQILISRTRWFTFKYVLNLFFYIKRNVTVHISRKSTASVCNQRYSHFKFSSFRQFNT